MTPQKLFGHADTGELWPAGTGACGFVDLPGAYQAALAVRALRIARGEVPLGRDGLALQGPTLNTVGDCAATVTRATPPAEAVTDGAPAG